MSEKLELMGFEICKNWTQWDLRFEKLDPRITIELGSKSENNKGLIHRVMSKHGGGEGGGVSNERSRSTYQYILSIPLRPPPHSLSLSPAGSYQVSQFDGEKLTPI